MIEITMQGLTQELRNYAYFLVDNVKTNKILEGRSSLFLHVKYQIFSYHKIIVI